MKRNYEEQANDLAKAIDIAVKAFRAYPPKNFGEPMISHTIKTYQEWKAGILNPAPAFNNVQSLTSVTNDALTYFQETGGETVDFFWQLIKENNLPYKRENKLAKILKTKKIETIAEYNFIIDVMVPYKQEGLLNAEETSQLNLLIGNFEQQKKKR